jgi:hypothetical protein
MFRIKLITALVMGATVWPAGADARSGRVAPVTPHAVPAVAASAPRDLRSPDTRDAARLAAETSPSLDLRSPDTRDAAREVALARAASTGVSPSRSAPSASDGFEWGDLEIGASVMLALVGLASGMVLLASRSRRRAPTA